MLFLIKGEKTIVIPPALLGPKLLAHIKEQLVREMEGEISREYGYCLWAGVEEGQGSEPLSDGIVDEDGNAVFTTHYSALYFNLFKEEVADGIVEEVKPKFGIWLSIGPIKAFIDKDNIPKNYTLNAEEDAYIDEDAKERLGKESMVRFRVMSTNIHEGTMIVIGTLADDYLGLKTNKSMYFME